MRLYFPVNLTGNVNMIEKLVLGGTASVLDLSRGLGGLTPLWCLSTPKVFIDPHWFSQK